MSSSPSPLLLLLLFLLFLLHGHPAAAVDDDPLPSSNGSTIYDILPQFGLPPGLFPDIVKSYSIADDGTFTVDLYGACYVDFDYLVYYAPRITGVLGYGGVDSLKGIQARRFLVWFDVDAIKVDLPPTEFIYFQVGWITRKLNVDQFQTVHSCRENRAAAGSRILRPIADGGDLGVVKL